MSRWAFPLALPTPGKMLLAAVLALMGMAGFWIITVPRTISANMLGPHVPDLHNGRILFEAGDCASCHARPGQNDPEKLGGGLALESPMGTFYVPNISPDPDDGIGRWTEENFASALLEGTSPDGRHYYPAFPYPSFRHMTLGDVRDLFAFIKSLPAVSGRIRPHELAFPFSIRRPLALWKFVFLDREALKLDPGQSKLWNRGAYLVNGPAHCAECHSPRNFFWALKNSQRFAGGPSIEGRGWIPNITQARLASWSEQDIAFLLQSGRTPSGDEVGGTMRAIVDRLRRISGDDRMAIAAYVKSLRPVEGPPRPDAK